MQTVFLVGTDHNFQRPVNGPYSLGIAQFRAKIQQLCAENQLAGIAEEMSVSALEEHGVTESVAWQVCASLGLRHQYSEPTSRIERYALGIRQDNEIRVEHLFSDWTQEQIEADVLARGRVPSDRIREDYWLRKVLEFNVWPLLFICGANHFSSFSTLLRTSGIHVVEAYADWEPSSDSSELSPKL